MSSENLIPRRPALPRDTASGGPRHARGAALVVSLLLLVTLTIIGVTGMRNATMEERMAGNLRDRNTAFQAAEGAVRDGERWLALQPALPETGATAAAADVYAEDATLPDLGTQSQTWWDDADNARAGTALVDDDNNALVAHQPRFLLQYVQFVPDTEEFGETNGMHFYRVTGHGAGQSEAARAVVQTTFVERF